MCVHLAFRGGERGCVCVCVHALVCPCAEGEQVCLCGVLTRPDNGHIWTERAERQTRETPTRMHTNTNTR